ncbi:branched-chain amino acid transport system II carrier protein [Capnocytophaga canimorsus]|nr:branched-chain amino acid transport system II carrier protein [Capnocytophaga canimorsus]WGU68476.1 branched-chain amino acid transport system II carrier protein [Capnocytophaga canimorsus]
MNQTRIVFSVAFAAFSMIFGAGNLILPPFLGLQAGEDWFLMACGFSLSSVLLAVLGMLVHARLQGTVMDFWGKTPTKIGLIYCLIIYALCVILPAPRTASVTYEMAIAPFADIPSVVFSFIYFALTLLVVFNRTKIIEIIGEYLTPIIIGIIFLVFAIAFWGRHDALLPTAVEAPWMVGLLEGYQTFDAIAGIVVGGVLVVSLDLKGSFSYASKRKIIVYAAIISGFFLFLIYTGLTYMGALFGNDFPQNTSRTDLVSGIGQVTLGKFGNAFLVTLVGIACFTTAVGIIAGAADFIKKICNHSALAYRITAIVGCSFGVIVGQLDLNTILNITLPFLLFIYPVTILLILLNVMPQNWVTRPIFMGGFDYRIYFRYFRSPALERFVSFGKHTQFYPFTAVSFRMAFAFNCPLGDFYCVS